MVKAFRPSSPPNDNISITVPLRRRPINQQVPENIYNISNCFLRTSPPPQESMSESSQRPQVINCQIPVRITNRNIKSRHNFKQANFNNLKEVKTLPLIGSRTKNFEFGPSVLLANAMSLLPKIDEVRCVVHEENPDLVCITETWLHASTINEHLFIPGYNVMFKNRASQLHGGVCIYIKNLIPYKRLSDLEDPEFEVLWSYIRPPRLPRGTSCIIVGTIYHPPRSDDSAMLDYLITTLISLEGLYPGCGILLTGDFNHLKIQRLVAQFKMKQLVRIPTRGNNILDLIITNMHQAYDCNSVCTIPPFGLSDHNGVLLRPKERSPNINSSRKILEKRDTRPSRKYEFGRYLSSIDWAILETVDTCEAKSQLLTELITTGADIIMPLKRVKVHVNDPPWDTSDFKKLIKARQQAYSNGEIETYRHYRNLVNRERKIIRNRFFASKVRHLKDTKPGGMQLNVLLGCRPLRL